MNVLSVYPENMGQETKYSQFQKRIISPCKTHDNFTKNLVQEVEVIVMWTTTSIITLLENFQPNRFVGPLLNF